MAAPYKSPRTKTLSSIARAGNTAELLHFAEFPDDAVFSVEEQVRYMEFRKLPGHGSSPREDARFPDVWVKNDGTVLRVQDMSMEHMCSTIALWLQKEFVAGEQERLGLRAEPAMNEEKKVPRTTVYDGPEVWLTQSRAVRNTPALPTMIERLKAIPEGLPTLVAMLHERANKSMDTVHSSPEEHLFFTPVFF